MYCSLQKRLRRSRLSIAYPVFSGGCIFSMVILSRLIFGERISVMNLVGALVIVVGNSFNVKLTAIRKMKNVKDT